MKGEEQDVKKAAQDIGKEAGAELLDEISAMTENLLKKGMPPKEAFNISDEKIEAIYANAYRLYNSGKYEEAGYLFRLLMLVEPTESKHAIGLGACLHLLKEYENAAQTYILAGIMDPENPVPHYHASDCYLQMRDKASAILMLDMAVKRSGEKPEYQILKDRALLTIESLKKELIES